jgi:2-desacetyl-2-hydroxyethyl bacteriochlorophyllide A dehydrogenase
LSRELKGIIKSVLLIAGVAHAMGLITVAIFHQTAHSLQDGTIIINIAGAALALIAGNGILIIAGSQWKRLSLPVWYGWSSIILGGLAIILGFALFGNPIVAPGIRERISIDSFIFWEIITGMVLTFNKRKESRAIHTGIRLERSAFTAIEVVLPGVAKPDGLLIRQRRLSQPKNGEVIIKVEASGVSFAERAMMRDKYPGMPKFPFIPGYDLVGIVVAVGLDVETSLLGRRVAVLTKTGGWSSHCIVSVNDILTMPDDVDPAEAETLVVNGITAWQMLHRTAQVKEGQTILVLGANGGVGTILTQLAINGGVKVIGASSPMHHEALKAQGIIPVDYNDKNFIDTVKSLAPEGINAVFDNIGGDSISRSFAVLKSGGKLVSYAIAFALNTNKSVVMLFLGLIAKLLWLNYMPNSRKAVFYNIWTGKGTDKFRNNMQEDFSEIIGLLRKGVLKPQIAARFPLKNIAEAMELAESRTTYGKIVLTN